MAERKEDLRGFLDSRLRDVEQKIRDIEQQNLVNFRWIIGICLLIFCSLIASIFSFKYAGFNFTSWFRESVCSG